MHRFRVIFVFSVLCLVCNSSFAQNSSAFPSLWYPRSLTAGSVGEEGVASRDPMDAMQYNPANLVRTRGIAASVFVNPWKLAAGWAGRGYPMTSIKAAVNLDGTGSFALEYSDWDFGEIAATSPIDPEGMETLHWYERSIAAAYAAPLGEEVSVGAQLRYAWEPFPQGQQVNHLLVGAGVSYEPDFLSHRMSLGFSLMNFGTAIEYPPLVDPRTGQAIGPTQADPPPAQMHLGIRGAAVAEKAFDIDLIIGAMKPFTKYSDPPDYQGQSAFSALFNDWDDFPEDVTGQIGLGFTWHPISLGAGIDFIQEMYLGYFSAGPAEGNTSFFTHGARVGLQACGVSLTAGYSGRWHNNDAHSYLGWDFPWETFQVDLNSDLSLFGGPVDNMNSAETINGIIVSAGYTYGLAIGKMKEETVSSSSSHSSYKAVSSIANKTTWSLEADFYVSKNAALISALAYARMTQTTTWSWSGILSGHEFVQDHPVETVSLESGFRYHPIEDFHPFFLQASLGIIRMNPVEESAPRYRYQTFTRLGIGTLFPVTNSGIVITPRIGFRTLLLPEYSNAERLGGYDQFEFGVNVGYGL